jgi:hypothetical protein
MKINNEISLWNLYLKTMKRQYISSSTETSEVVLVSERNNAVLSEQTSDLSAFLCTQMGIAFFIFRISIRISEGSL